MVRTPGLAQLSVYDTNAVSEYYGQLVPQSGEPIGLETKKNVQSAEPRGLEPPTSAVTGQRSNQLSYDS